MYILYHVYVRITLYKWAFFVCFSFNWNNTIIKYSLWYACARRSFRPWNSILFLWFNRVQFNLRHRIFLPFYIMWKLSVTNDWGRVRIPKESNVYVSCLFVCSVLFCLFLLHILPEIRCVLFCNEARHRNVPNSLTVGMVVYCLICSKSHISKERLLIWFLFIPSPPQWFNSEM